MTGAPVLELRAYTLVPGTRADFHQRFEGRIVPMLVRHGISVVHCGPSLHGADGYCLLRSFTSLDERDRQLGEFYNSAEWLEQHEIAVMDMILSYETAVIATSPEAIAALGAGLSSPSTPGFRPA